MSKLIDMLEKAGRQLSGPMGFRPAAGRGAPASQIVLLAGVLPEALAKDRSIAEAEADAFLLDAGPDVVEEAAKALGSRVWGLRSANLTAAGASKLAESDCDFVVFESLESEASALNVEDLGMVAALDGDVDEETVRSLGALPVDAALLRPSLRGLPLTVRAAAGIQKLARLVGKPAVVEAPDGIERQDIEALAVIGVAGLIVDVENAAGLDRIAETKEAIARLPRRRPESSRRDALLPPIGDAGVYADELDDEDL